MIDQSPRSDCLLIAKTTAVMFRRLMEYCDPGEADTWLNSAHPELSGETPISVIASERGGEVCAIIDDLGGDGYI
jgi:uncharacterized protein (DUF2384 family)